MTETLPAQPLRLMLVAAEPSADKLGAALMAALKAMAPGGVVFCGCGGPAMAAEGFESLFPIDRLAVMGLKDVLPVIPEALKRVKELAVYAQAQKVDAAILIDSWGIGYRVAKHMKQLAPDIPCIKYVAPQVWASRPQRVQKVKTYFDCVLTVLPFEPPWFERAGVPAYYVGNPNFEAAAKPGDGAAFRHRHGIGAAPLLAVLPGSRTNEIRFLLEPFGETVRRVCVDMPDLRIVVPAAPAVADAVKAAAADWPGAPVVVEGEDARRDAFAAADGALAASGTVTTELGLAATPMIVAYKVGWMTGVWARKVLTSKYVTILNVAAGWEVVPEYIQEIATPDNLTRAVKAVLTDEATRARQFKGFEEAFARLELNEAASPAAERAAGAVLDFLMRHPASDAP